MMFLSSLLTASEVAMAAAAVVGAAAAACTLTVGAAGRGLVGAGRVLRLCPHGLRSRLMLSAHGSGFALAARAKHSRLGFCPCGSCYALAAQVLPSLLEA